MTPFEAVLLSFVEGITEFLPISSTGHLVLASGLLGISQTEFAKSFEIFIQLGAMLAVVILYWQQFIRSRAIFLRICTAFVPTAIVGFVAYKFVKNTLLGNPLVTIVALFLGGIILILLELLHREKDGDRDALDSLPLSHAVIIGLFQSFAVIPGVSRAAATIAGGLLLGLKRKPAVEFSFLLAVPTIAAATGLDLLAHPDMLNSSHIALLAIGFAGSFITAYITIRYFLTFIKTHTFIPFGIYRIAIALVYIFFLNR